MKRRLSFAALCLAGLMCFAACAKVVPVYEQYHSGDELSAAIDGKQLTTPMNKLEKAALEWARTSVKFKYLLTPMDSKVGIEPHLARVKGVSAEDTAFSEYSDTFTLHATLCTVDFVPLLNRTENLQELGNDSYPDDTYRYYRAKVLILSAEQDGVATCIGIRYTGEFNIAKLGREAYLRAAEIQELSISLKPFPEKPLPEGFTVVSLKLMISSHSVILYGYYNLNSDVLAAAYWDKTDTPNLFHAGVLLFDRAGRLIKDVAIGDFTEMEYYDTNYRFFKKDGKIVVNDIKEFVDGMPVIERCYMVDAKGNVTIEAVTKPKDAVVMRLILSPDGLKQAYSDQHSLYIKDAKGTKLLFKGEYSEEYVGSYYAPYQWLDNNLLICTAGRYEGVSTFVVDSITGETIVQAAGSPIFERRGKLYCEGYEEGGGYYVEALDLKKLETVKLIPGKVQYRIDTAKFSDNNLFCFQQSYSPDQYHFIFASLDDGSVLKDCSFYQEGMRNEFLLLSDTLAVLFRDKDMLLVDLDKLK